MKGGQIDETSVDAQLFPISMVFSPVIMGDFMVFRVYRFLLVLFSFIDLIFNSAIFIYPIHDYYMLLF